jgi:N-succinyldiaminopimelate aminotransferase
MPWAPCLSLDHTRLVKRVRNIKQYLSFASGTPFQLAVAHGLRMPATYFEDLRREMEARRDLLMDGLSAVGLRPSRSTGGYFVIADISGVTEQDGKAYCRQLVTEHGVAAIPNQVFYADPSAGSSQIRFTFCKARTVIAEGIARLQAARFSGSDGSSHARDLPPR